MPWCLVFFNFDVGFVRGVGSELLYGLGASYGRPRERTGKLVDLEDIGNGVELATKPVSMITCYGSSLAAVGSIQGPLRRTLRIHQRMSR